MEISKEILKQKFEEYNELYFDNVLLLPQFCLFYGSGKSVALCRMGKYGRRAKILVARNAILSEDDLKSVLIHEMIHLYLFQTEKKAAWPYHGWKFRKMVRLIKKKYGITILIRYPHIKFILKKKKPTHR